MTTLAKATKILPGKTVLVPAILNYALNFSSVNTEVNAKDFQIIYQYLQDNREGIIEPFVFKTALTPEIPTSDISNLAGIKLMNLRMCIRIVVGTLHEKLAKHYHLVYGFSDGGPFSPEISIFKEDLLLERLKHFLERIPTGSAVAFITSGNFYPTNTLACIKLLARLLGREEPIDALSDANKVDSWLSFDGQKSQDLFTNSGHFGTKKTEFVIELLYESTPTLAGNALSNYTCIENLDIKNIVDVIAEKSKNEQEGFNFNQIMLDNALNFSSKLTQADAKDFLIIYQYLQDNHEEPLGQFVFKNSLIPKSNFSSFANNIYEELADIYEIRCVFSDVDQSTIEISVSKKIPQVERLKNALSNYTCLPGYEIKNISDLLNLISEETKIVPGGINCIQILLDNALNFSSKWTKADANDFQIIYQYLQDNHEEKLGPFVFKHLLTPTSRISKLAKNLDEQLDGNYHLVYGFSEDDPFSTEISVYKEVSSLEKFKNFFESIPTGSNVAYVASDSLKGINIFPFIKFLATLHGRYLPIGARSFKVRFSGRNQDQRLSSAGPEVRSSIQSDASKVDSWLAMDWQKSQDIFTNSDGFGTKKTKFVIALSDERTPEVADIATSKYTFIQISNWDVDLFMDILKSMEDEQYQTILLKIMSQVVKDPLVVQTLIGK